MRYLRIGVQVFFIMSMVFSIVVSWIYKRNHDLVAPVLVGENDYLELSVNSSDEELLAGLTASDDRDGDITERIMVSSISRFGNDGTCKVKYVVFDEAHNFATYTRRIKYVDYVAPRFVLSEPLIYRVGENIRYIENIKAMDSLSGDISERIKVISSNVSNYLAGVYPVRLEVTNRYGDTSAVELSIVVNATEPTTEIVLKEYITYVEKGAAFDPYAMVKGAWDKNGQAVEPTELRVNGMLDTDRTGSYQLFYSIGEAVRGEGVYLTVVVTEGDK